jgi:SAM-dependent methyltransferase
MNMLKLNLGSNNKRREGFTNIDILDCPNVDIRHDLTSFPWPVEDNTVDEILAEEFLEHIPFRKIDRLLRECFRVLQNNGVLRIQVPDIGSMCHYFAAGLVCDCVPRKAGCMEEYRANPNCQSCLGNAKIHPERWLFAFSGAQKHEYDAHLSHWTDFLLSVAIKDAGFEDVKVISNGYKLIATACKKNLYDQSA